MSNKEYWETLPKKRMGAGCLFFDQSGSVLLVKPSYKPVWEIPGGVIEDNESPRGCCQREVLEELGLDVEVGSLLVVDYMSESDTKTEAMMFIFLGGTLTEAEISRIQLPPHELTEFAFFTQSTLPEQMTDSLRQRLLAAWKQVGCEGAIYLEDQQS